jgi:hypothetical protein
VSAERRLDRLLARVGRILRINGLEAITREEVDAAREGAGDRRGVDMDAH